MADDQGTESVMIGEQVGTICTIIEHAIPIKVISFDDANAILGKNREAFIAAIRKAFLKKRLRKHIPVAPSQRSEQLIVANIPAVGVEFELTLDGDTMQPERCCDGMTGWEYKGFTIIGKYTRRFKLVRIGYCKDIDDVKKQLQLIGGSPSSQWMLAFRAKYSKHDNRGPIGVCDPSWELDRIPGTYFPSFFGGIAGIHFSRRDLARDESWRWLVEVRVGETHAKKLWF